MRAADLYLAFACATGSAAALQAFGRKYLARIEKAHRKIDNSDLTAEDARQLCWEKLFVGTPERPAKITEYGGRGDLAHWVTVVATRTLLDAVKRDKRDQPAPTEFFDVVPAGADDPELDLARRRYSAEFKDALAAAAQSLSTQERNLLRYTFLDGLGVDAIGSVYGVHRATASRWVTRARETLQRRLREELAQRIDAPDRELESLLRLVESRFEATLERILK